MLLFLSITAAVAGGGVLLALVSDAFAYELSRAVEAVFDMIEYRLALREHRRGVRLSDERVAYKASYSHAG